MIKFKFKPGDIVKHKDHNIIMLIISRQKFVKSWNCSAYLRRILVTGGKRCTSEEHEDWLSEHIYVDTNFELLKAKR